MAGKRRDKSIVNGGLKVVFHVALVTGSAGEEAEERLVAVASRRGARRGVPCIICEEAEKWLTVSRGVLLMAPSSLEKPPDLDPFPQHLCQQKCSKNARFKVLFELFC